MLQSAMKDEKQTVRKSSFWGIRCESGKKYSQIVNQKYHISMAALDPTSVKSGKEVVSLVVERDGSEFLLCNLQKDSVLQVNLNLFFDKGEKVVFSLKGQGIVHLTGYLIKDDNDQSDITLQSKKLNDSIMLAKVKSSGGTNRSVQSKKNLSTQNDSWQVESEENLTPKKKLFASLPKKGNENFQTNITGVLEGGNWEVDSNEDKNSSPMKNNTSSTKKSVNVSPSQKTPQKKLFGTAKQESEDSSEDEESSDDDEDSKQLLRLAQKRNISYLDEEDDDDDEDDEDFEIDEEEDDDDDDDDDDSSEESDEEDDEPPVKKKPNKDLPSSKKFKAETSTPLHSKKSPIKNVTEVINIDDDSKNGDMNSSIGRTPMPKKKLESVLQKNALNDMKKAKISKNESSESDSDEEMETSTSKVKESNINKSATQLNTSGEVVSTEKKKKKKKKKAKADNSSIANESSSSINDSSLKAKGNDLSKAQYSKKLKGGVEYEDIRIGYGPIAKKGRLVHVHYTGRLENNKVFDSCMPGNGKPFAFKLGAGQVIEGWDVAVEGMKVGGKRRIKIPPQMGYKEQRAGPIPPNSTLYFIVELKAVS